MMEELHYGVPIVPLFGHEVLRRTFERGRATSTLPSALLLHGPALVGKQRLALWLARAVLCDRARVAATNGGAEGAELAENGGLPCEKCPQCRYSAPLQHPDIHWYFPRPRLKDSDPSLEDVRMDYAGAIAQRVSDGLLYPAPSGSDGIYVATVRALVREAAIAPAIARRKVFIVGDAERMVSQEGSDQAANAFLKLLEEPPANTTIILTSSEPGALLPTIRSRVVSFMVHRLPERDLVAFLEHPVTLEKAGDTIRKMKSEEGGAAMRSLLRSGAPGQLLESEGVRTAFRTARSFVESALAGRRSEMIKGSFAIGAAGARGNFTDFLDAVAAVVHEKVREAVDAGRAGNARELSAAVHEVERARELARGNVSPQLTAMRLADVLSRAAT